MPKRARTGEEARAKARRVATEVAAYVEALKARSHSKIDGRQADVDVASLLINFDDNAMLCILRSLNRRSLMRYSCLVSRAIRISDEVQDHLWDAPRL